MSKLAPRSSPELLARLHRLQKSGNLLPSIPQKIVHDAITEFAVLIDSKQPPSSSQILLGQIFIQAIEADIEK